MYVLEKPVDKFGELLRPATLKRVVRLFRRRSWCTNFIINLNLDVYPTGIGLCVGLFHWLSSTGGATKDSSQSSTEERLVRGTAASICGVPADHVFRQTPYRYTYQVSSKSDARSGCEPDLAAILVGLPWNFWIAHQALGHSYQ